MRNTPAGQAVAVQAEIVQDAEPSPSRCRLVGPPDRDPQQSDAVELALADQRLEVDDELVRARLGFVIGLEVRRGVQLEHGLAGRITSE